MTTWYVSQKTHGLSLWSDSDLNLEAATYCLCGLGHVALVFSGLSFFSHVKWGLQNLHIMGGLTIKKSVKCLCLVGAPWPATTINILCSPRLLSRAQFIYPDYLSSARRLPNTLISRNYPGEVIRRVQSCHLLRGLPGWAPLPLLEPGSRCGRLSRQDFRCCC